MSAISWKLEAVGSQARPAVANLRAHESTTAGTAAVNSGHMGFEPQPLKAQVYGILLYKQVHLHWFQNYFYFLQ